MVGGRERGVEDADPGGGMVVADRLGRAHLSHLGDGRGPLVSCDVCERNRWDNPVGSESIPAGYEAEGREELLRYPDAGDGWEAGVCVFRRGWRRGPRLRGESR